MKELTVLGFPNCFKQSTCDSEKANKNIFDRTFISLLLLSSLSNTGQLLLELLELFFFCFRCQKW